MNYSTLINITYKSDRSASYACRYVPKNIVAAGLARKCEVQISYAIGVAHPVSIFIIIVFKKHLSYYFCS